MARKKGASAVGVAVLQHSKEQGPFRILQLHAPEILFVPAQPTVEQTLAQAAKKDPDRGGVVAVHGWAAPRSQDMVVSRTHHPPWVENQGNYKKSTSRSAA